METEKLKYEFSAKTYMYSASEKDSGWMFVSLPKEMSVEIRENFKWLEEGWGRMKATAVIGETEWQTAIWFDTKQDTYMLPLKAAVRKKEKVTLDEEVKVTVLI